MVQNNSGDDRFCIKDEKDEKDEKEKITIDYKE